MQMGSRFKQGMFDEHIQQYIMDWAKPGRRESSLNSMSKESMESICVAEEPTASSVLMELTRPNRPQIPIS